MVAIMLEQQQQPQTMQHLVPSQKGINLSILIDFLLQKTYHDLTVLSELLPRKPDIERKIEIIRFATKARQQFIRLLALVKWASSDDRVDKFQAISSCLDQQNAYFIDTADTLARIARETLVQARLPNFSLPTAVDVLTTGTFNRLPKCIKTRIVPEDPISASDKSSTLKQLNEVIQQRLVSSKIPSQFTDLKIGDGKLTIRVEHEFEVMLMLMGDGDEIPWRVLNIEFLMEENETGDGRSLVHGMQVHFLHQIVQSRLIMEENPLVDLYETLHHFCLSLQLEVLHTQSERLIRQRWSDFVKIDEYVSSDKLKLSFCRSSAALTRTQNNGKGATPSICICLPKEDDRALILKHVPELHVDQQLDVGGVYLSSNCLSIEKIFSYAVRMYSLSQLRNLSIKLSTDAFFAENSSLDSTIPCLRITPFRACLHDEAVLITVDRRSGAFCIDVKMRTQRTPIKQLESTLQSDVNAFIQDFHNLRCTLFLEKCRRSLTIQPVFIHNKCPLNNQTSFVLSNLPVSRLYLQFKRYPNYFLIAAISIDKNNPTKPINDTYHLLCMKHQTTNTVDGQVVTMTTTDDKTNLEQRKTEHLIQLDVDAIMKENKKKESAECLEYPRDLRKRKDSLIRNHDNVVTKKRKITTDNTAEPSSYHPIEFKKQEDIVNDVITRVVSVSSRRIPFIQLCEQLMEAQFILESSTIDASSDHALLVLDYPTPPGCNENEAEQFKQQILHCDLKLDVELDRWLMMFTFKKPDVVRCSTVRHRGIVLEYCTTCLPSENKKSYLADRILSDLKGLTKLYKHAIETDGYLRALKETCVVSTFEWKRFDFKTIVFTYSARQCYDVKFGYDGKESKFTIRFSENGLSKDKCPHYLTERQLTEEFNGHGNMHYVLKIIESTYVPLKAITSIDILPSLPISNRVLSVVNNFTIIAHTSDHVKIIYRNVYVLDVYLMETAVLIKDGTLYRTDATKAMRGFTPINNLTPFLQQFADKFGPNSGHDLPATPGGVEFDQQHDHFAATDSQYKDSKSSMKSPAVVISSPQASYNQFTSLSPGNPASVPSPGTFLQPSPLPLTAMSPNAWPGSPPLVQCSPALVQGSPAPQKPGSASSQSRLALSSINVTHAPIPVFLTHAGFKMLMTAKECNSSNLATTNVSNGSKCSLCPLERFFGSIQLRSHLLRVIRTDDTLKLEMAEHGVVIFSGTGKYGPENGLQYSVRMDASTMEHLVLKVTTLKGHEWSEEEIQILEQFFEYKVVCSPYTVCALTAFARTLGAQPKIMKDFIRIMKLEMQTDWSKFKYRVEWCLTIPPRDAPTIALPGTPAVVLKSKNLIFLQLTSMKNEEDTVTITLVHDMKTNTVLHLEFPKSGNFPPEPQVWAVRARAAVTNLLNTISDEIAKKVQPIYCAVYTILLKLQMT